MKASETEFIKYLLCQVGQPYVWGGQHLRLTPENYKEQIKKRESNLVYREAAIQYCTNLFNAGATVLYAYDCSGLGMYYLQNYSHVLPHDYNANGMMHLCTMVDKPKKGYWVFRVKSDGRASHIGYMVSDTEVVHSKGRAYGVVKERYKSSYWHRVGNPKCIDFDADPEPIPGPYIFDRVLKYGCVGNDVIELKELLIAHGFSKGITVDTASSERFGSNTKRRVKDYQKSVGLKVDGIAGHDTIVSLGGVWLGE